MIAKYNDKYFCVDTTITPVQIWAYAPIEGFDMKTTRRGTVYYEKFVDISEIDDIFDVGFGVRWNGYWFGYDYIASLGKARLFSSNSDIVKKFKMNEFEHGAWDLYVNIEECTDFQITYKSYLTKKSESYTLNAEEWQKLWVKLIDDLIPQR